MGRKFPVEILTSDEIHALLKKCSKRAPTGIRNSALIVCLYRAGLRITEALQLRTKDIDHKANSLRVLHGKGNKARLVGIDPIAMGMIERWLEVRAKLKVNSRSPVFCTLDGSPVAAVYCRNLLKRLARKAGIEKRVHPHQLRHTLACELRGEGIDIGVISKQLGHSSISTTARYLDHIAPVTVLETMAGRTW